MKKLGVGYVELLTASLLMEFGGSLIGPYYVLYVKNIVGKFSDIGYASTIFLIASGLLIIGIGKISDKLNKELIVIFGSVLSAVGYFLYLVIKNSWHLFALQIIFAISTACLAAPFTAMVSDNIDERNKGLKWGLSSGGGKIFVGLSVLAGTFLYTYLGFAWIFVLMGILNIFATYILFRYYLSVRDDRIHSVQK